MKKRLRTTDGEPKFVIAALDVGPRCRKMYTFVARVILEKVGAGGRAPIRRHGERRAFRPNCYFL